MIREFKNIKSTLNYKVNLILSSFGFTFMGSPLKFSSHKAFNVCPKSLKKTAGIMDKC